MTPSNGSAVTYDMLTVVIACTIASINAVAAPTTGLTYTLYATTLSVDLLPNTYTQTPDCRFIVTETASWTIPSGSPIAVNSANAQQIDVVSLDRTKVGTHAVSMAITFAYSAQSFTETDTISFTITIIDPCETTVINDAVFSPTTITVTNGATATATFNEVTDTVEVANNIDTLCQQRSYTLLEADGTTAAVFLALTGATGGPYTITASPTLDTQVGTHNLKLKTTLTAYPSNSNNNKITTIPVVVSAASCDKTKLGWVATPAVTKTVNVAAGATTLTLNPYAVDPTSKTATPEARACGWVSADETYTMAAVQKGQGSLPDFVTLSGNILTITPIDHTDIGTWTITATMTTTNGDDPSWDAATITVGCIVTSIAAASPPTSGLTYNLYDAPLLIDLTTYAYTQTPPCGYSFTEVFTWTIPTAAQPYII
jgi:ribosomal protein L11